MKWNCWAVAVVGGCSLCASGAPDGGLEERLGTVVDRAHLGRFWGAVVVRVGGKDVLRRGYGFEGPGLAPIDAGVSLFDVGSVSKSLTAAAALAMADEGLLTTETTLAEVFPGEDAGGFAGVTVADLLGHRLGVPDSRIAAHGAGSDERARWVRALGATPVETRSDAFSYSNVCYFLLAAVIEARAGEPFEEAVRARVIERAGLARAGFVGDGAVAGGRATARVDAHRGLAADTFAYPWNWGQRGATGVVMTADDAARWAEFAWADGLLGGAVRAGRAAGYAAGWSVQTEGEGVWRIGHGGTTGGYRCEVAHYPAAADGAGVTVVVMTNGLWDASDLERRLARVVAPEPARPVRGGVFLHKYGADGGGVVEVSGDLAWKVMPGYTGRTLDGKTVVDERPTMALVHDRFWPVLVTMDHAEAEALLAALTRAIGEVMAHPDARSTPFASGMRLRMDASGLPLGEGRSYQLSPGSRWTVAAEGVRVVARLVDEATGRVLATVDMDGAGTAALVRGLQEVLE